MPFVCGQPLEGCVDPRAALRACREITEEVGDSLRDRTKRLTPVSKTPAVLRGGRAPGTLRESIYRTDVDRLGRVYRVRVRTEDPIAPFVEYTTRPHVIRPRADRGAATVLETGKRRGTVEDGRASLSWMTPHGRVFARVVHHPGTRGHHMFARAAAETEARLSAIARGPLLRFERDLIRR